MSNGRHKGTEYINIGVTHKNELIAKLPIHRKEDKRYYIEINDLIRFCNLQVKKWNGLSDNEIKKYCDVIENIKSNDVIEFEWHEMEKIARAIEAKLKEKNHG